MEYIILLQTIYLLFLTVTIRDQNFMAAVVYRLAPLLLGICGIYVTAKLFNLI